MKLGPVLGCKYFGRHLLRMLALCYVNNEQLRLLPSNINPFKSIRSVCGDINAKKIMDCLLSLVQNYGEQIILLFYFPHLIETVRYNEHIEEKCQLLFYFVDSIGQSSTVHSYGISFT